MAGRQNPQILTDAPVTQLKNWAGFSAKRDKTMLPPQYLVEPSQNCFIPDTDKVVPRGGSQLVFEAGAPRDTGIIGKYTKFKNFIGLEMDVKAYRDVDQGEQVMVLYNGVYVPITVNPNLNFNGTDKIYFSTYTDSTLNLAEQHRIPRLCWVNGYDHKDLTGRVFSWTGGIANIDNIVGNQIFLPTGVSWRELGFTLHFPPPTLGPQRIYVTINGVEYFSSLPNQLDTNVLTLNAVPAAAIGDVVTSAVEVDSLASPMDFLKMNKNYMYYGNFKLRQWWMSNQFGRQSVTRITESNAAQDDLIINPNNNYVGTGRHIYKFIIVAVHPAIDEQTFESPRGGTNAGSWDTSGYTGTGETTYRIDVVSDMILTRQVGTQAGDFLDGEVVQGQTSGALAQIIPGQLDSTAPPNLNFPGGNVALLDTTNSLQTGEVIVGLTSGASMTLFQAQPQNTVKFFRNNIEYIPPGVAFQGTLYSYLLRAAGTGFQQIDMGDGIFFNPPYDPVNDVVIVYSYQVGDSIGLRIQNQEPDEFTWQQDNGAVVGPFDVTTLPFNVVNGPQTGIFIKWGNDTGHNIGDFWIIEVNQAVTRPWANFYYTIDFTSQLSLRRPGEGYVYNLPSNFWTMDTFEEAMYVNTSNGEWGYTSPTLSADLLSEDISFTPLKQVTSSKVLYPYLTGHSRNDMLFIDENHNLNSMGRLALIERVQMDDMSDFVRNAFQAASFLDGSILFQNDKIWITSPRDETMFCYDDRSNTQYWQPPQIIPNLGLLTLIGIDLYVHSFLNTGTRTLNDPTAEGDDGVEYEVIARSSTFDHKDRWHKKVSNMGFWEGYVDELPPMKMLAYFDVDGCSGIEETDILPVFCTDVKNKGVLGGGNNANHPQGSAPTMRTNYARFNWNDLKVHHFYFSSLEFRCRAKRHPYQILSMGLNLAESKFNNKEYVPPENAMDKLLPINTPQIP